ncbi:uncharacterized protein LOC134712747 [Mytilus trossulus]|uniref:uncharacterized protein LOC134712747 n=1 Tax=Mytilus trossulus TaxID=6551 RepID=UPI003004C9DE
MKITVSKVLVLVSGLVGVIFYWLAVINEYWHTESSDNNVSQSPKDVYVRMLIMLRGCGWLLMPASWFMMMLSYCKLHKDSTMLTLPYWLNRSAIVIFSIYAVFGLLEMYRFCENIGLSWLCFFDVCMVFTISMMYWNIHHDEKIEMKKK